MLLLALSLARADDRFFPGEDDAAVHLDDLVARGVAEGRSGRLIVRADDPAALAGHPGVASVKARPGGVLFVLPAPGVDDLALSRALHDRPDVAWAIPDLVVRLVPATLPDDPLVADQWHLENTGQGGRTVDVDIDAETAWAYATGAGQLVAVLDSGVQLDHPDLSVIPGHDYIDGDDDPTPASDWSGPHGTGCSGVAAAVGGNGYGVAGVAYDADVYAIRLIGGSTTLSDVYDAFVEAVDAGASVLSNSWGYTSACEEIPAYRLFDTMFAYAEDEGRGGLGAAVVFAAGNGACDVALDGMLAHETAVVVAAVEWNDERASYSSYGDAVDIAAPTSILSTDVTPGGYGSYGDDDAFSDWFSGTSAATPVVSGVLALMFEANPRLTAAQAREVLCDTAVRIDLGDVTYDAEGRHPYYGCGRVDAGAAVAAVANEAPAAPVPAWTDASPAAARVVLAWAPAEDADGDTLTYVVDVKLGDGEPVRTSLDGTSLDLTGTVAEGDVVTWSVAAVDPWGEGPASDPVTFTVATEAPAPAVEEPGGCGVVPPAGVVGVALAMLGARRRRDA